MTLLEAIKTYPGLESVDDQFIDKIAIDRGFTVSVSYTASLKKNADLICADIYSLSILEADFSEEGLSISIPRGQRISWAQSTYIKHGETENAAKLGGPTISDATLNW